MRGSESRFWCQRLTGLVADIRVVYPPAGYQFPTQHFLFFSAPTSRRFQSSGEILQLWGVHETFFLFREYEQDETRSNAARAGVSEANFPSTNRANNRIRETLDDNMIYNKAKSLKSNILFIIGLNIEANELKIAIYIFVTTS